MARPKKSKTENEEATDEAQETEELEIAAESESDVEDAIVEEQSEDIEQEDEPDVAAEAEEELEEQVQPLDTAVLMQNEYILAAADRIGGEARRSLAAAYDNIATKDTLPAAEDHAKEIWCLKAEGCVVYSDGEEWRHLIEDQPI
jgi:hypothetical protein